MIYERLCELIKDYPKLNEVCQAMIREEYFITKITTTSMSPVQQDFTSIEVIMENHGGERILLIFTEGIVDSMTVEEFPSTNEKIHPNILLNKEIIHDKTFKKRAFGGYDMDEVDGFLDLIIKDYRFIEEGLIKEIKMLKEDMQKLRGH
ncbi:DivIVA domain-containing protein [Peribacillus sp. TH27]|uniref:DivIVA domain-containing protein n=1 Tax=Peribacillus sp. TH27 TaxID=2798484 RepID=UPI001F5B5191|nr:DivIVA domain-containing protein [Peribacillus sp. TH27]